MSVKQSQQEQIMQNLKEVKRMTEEAKAISANTNLMAHQQGEQLERIRDKTKDINTTLNNSEEKVKEMSSYWYYLKNKVKRAFGFGKVKTEGGSGNVEGGDEEEEKVEKRQGKVVVEEKPLNAQDEALDEISKDLGILSRQAKTLGKTLDKQIKLTGEIDKEMDKANTTTANINRGMRKILQQ